MKILEPSLRVEFSEQLPPLYPVRLLYANRSLPTASHKVNFHEHPFWQIEIVRRGSIEFEIGSQKMLLQEGAIVVIPPRLSHRFIYQVKSEYFSFKFDVESNKLPFRPNLSYQLPEHPELQAWGLLIEKIFPEELPASGPQSRWLAYTLSALVQVYFHPESLQKTETRARVSLIEQIRGFIQKRQGHAITVNELASALKYSPSHLSTLFKKTKKQSLKNFIDQERGKLIAHKLKFSEHNITSVAESLGFPSVLAFSHYCKRALGKSPRTFRKTMMIEKE